MNDKNLSRKDFDQRVKDLVKLIREKTIVFPEDNHAKQVLRIKRAKKDLVYFAQTYFPHYVTAEFANWHLEELKNIQVSLDTSLAHIVAEIWARGFGKSSLLAVILPIWAGLTQKSMFTIFVGKDANLSKERTVAIKMELCWNGRLKWDYPDMAMTLEMGEEKDFETPDGERYIALGYKQAIRGRVHGRHRPRLVIIDDLENHTDLNPEIAAEKYRYVTEEAFGCFGEKGGLIVWLGNLTNSDSALSRFVNKCDQEPDNEFVRYRLVKAEDDNGHSNWQAAYPDKVLAAKKQVMGQAGYDRHFMMKPGVDGDVFREEWFRFWNPYGAKDFNPNRGTEGQRPAGTASCSTGDKGLAIGGQMPGWQELLAAPIVSYCDPSLGAGESADYKALITVAFWGGRYWILDVGMKKCTILDMLDYQYDLDKRFRTRQFMEQNFWQRIIWEYLPQKAAEKGYMLGISGVENRLKKEERILTLQPLFEWGHVWFCCEGREAQILKEQLTGFPHAGHDDGPDALAGAIARFRELANANQYETLEKGYRGFDRMY